MIYKATRLMAATLLIVVLISNYALATNKPHLSPSNAYLKSLYKNATIMPYAAYVQNEYLYNLKTQPTQELSRYTYKDVTGFENNNKKDFSEKILGNKSKVAFDPNSMPGAFWGSTGYDFQTNGCMPERVKLYESGGKIYLQNLWMCDISGQPGWPNRGTFYDVIDATNPNNLNPEGYFDSPIEKINNRTLRTGWPAIVQFPDGTIGTPSHDTTPPNPFRSIVWSKNSTFKGTQFTTKILANTNPLWARAAIDGKGNIHVVYTWTNNSNTMDKFGEIGYRRSTDGGNTWSDEILFTGANAFDGPQNRGDGADTYAMDAKGDKVVLVYYDRNSNFMMRTSLDNGVTWSEPKVIFTANHQTYYILQDLGNNKAWVTSDTTFTPGIHMDVILDSQNNAHYVSSVIPAYIRGIATIENNEIKSIENDTTFSGSIYLAIGLFYNYEGSGKAGILFGNPQGKGTEQFGENKMRISRRWGASYSFYPQLGIDKDDNIYCVYSGIVLDDTKDVTLDIKDAAGNKTGEQTVSGFFGHLYITHKLNGNYGWSEPKLITPNGGDALFPSMCNTVYTDKQGEKWIYVAYSANGIPGDRVTTSELPYDEEYIYTLAYKASDLNPSLELSVENNVNDELEYISVNPNPASDIAYIHINSNSGDVIENMAINDLFGNRVLIINDGKFDSSNQIIPVKINGLSSGIYSITATINGKPVTKLLTVVK